MPTKEELDPATWYGQATVEPGTPVVAGRWGTWTAIYTAGRYGVDDGAHVKVSLRTASDFGDIQTKDPSGPGYVSVSTTGQALVRARIDPHGHLRPFFRTVVISVFDGSLAEGDKLLVVFGDTSAGGPGVQAQSFIDEDFEFRVSVESFQTGIAVDVPGTARFRVVNAAPKRLVAVVPSRAGTGEKVVLRVKAEDAYGNPCYDYEGDVELSCKGASELPDRLTITPADKGMACVSSIHFGAPGVYRITVRDPAGGLEAETNPIEVCSAEPRRLFWGDFHGQSGFSVGTGTIEQYFGFARDVGWMDFTAHNANDFQIESAHWEELKKACRRFHEPGRFVTFLGWEWSGTTPAGGDHNVYCLDDDMPLHRSSHWQVADKSDAGLDCYPVSELYRVLREEGNQVMVVPHVGGRYANLDFHDPELEPVVEICSCHGRFEWLFEDAVRRGYRVGVVATGDDHTGRPGASYPVGDKFGVRNGLTAVVTGSLTREAVWAALTSRRCYATTGERILLDFAVDGSPMGSEVSCRAHPVCEVRVVGTAPLYSVEIKRGLEVAYSHPVAPRRDPSLLRVAWGGARGRGRNRRSPWTGGLRLLGGRITDVRGFGFDSPYQGVTRWDGGEVAWRSFTSGDVDGVWLRVDAGDDAAIEFETPAARFRAGVGEIRHGGFRWQAGGLEQHVLIETGPDRPTPREVGFTFTDTGPLPGVQPYYVRVMQQDTEMAWSSPVYVRYISG